MEVLQIRETLHEYIDTADEKKLEAIYTILQDSISIEFKYNEDELADIYARRHNYKSGNEQTLVAEKLLNLVHQNKS